MKKIIVTTAFLTAIAFMATASPIRTNDVIVSKVTQEEIPIKPEELPDAVKTTLSTAYTDWTVEAAFRIEMVSGNQYKTRLFKEGKKKEVKFNSEGKVIDSAAFVSNVIQTDAIQEETPIKIEELPEAVQKSILANFAEWAPTAAFRISKENKEAVYYKVELTKIEEKKMVKFNKEGEVIS